MQQKPFTLGILGGGQLGRMTSIAAAQLGIAVHIYAPDAATSPAAEVSSAATTAPYEDTQALAKFGQSVDAVISEFENVPAKVMEILSAYCPVSPGVKALAVAQNRLSEKALARELGIATPDFWAVRSPSDLQTALAELNGDGILKTTRLGYDGKGQMRIATGDVPNAAAAKVIFTSMHSDELILESLVPFVSEVSFLVGRRADGALSIFPASQNLHVNGILAHSVAPAELPDELREAGQSAACAIASALNLVGLLAMEAFIGPDGTLIFNEIAPRPHNSFHWTIEGCQTSQFTQLVRIMAGLPFGGTQMRGQGQGQWQMQNLLGQHMCDIPSHLEQPARSVHLYGKTEAKTDRKMGHVSWPV